MSHHMGGATENDSDLLAEVKIFWIEPVFCVSVLDELQGEISFMAVAVVQWLQVCTSYEPIKLVLNDCLIVRNVMTHQRKLYHFGKPMLWKNIFCERFN